MTTNKYILFFLAALIVLTGTHASGQQRMPEAFAQGKKLYRERKYEEATVAFYKVLSELNALKTKPTAIVDSEKITLDFMNLCFSESREMNIPFKNLDFDTTVTEEYFFSITEVTSLEHDSAIVTINEGIQDGIYWGAETYVNASAGNSKDDTARSQKFLGSARIIELSDYSCKVVVRFFKKYRGFKIYPKDMLDVYVHPIRGSKKGLMYELNRLNIIFNNNTKEEILNKRGFFYNTDPNFERAVMNVYAKEIRNFATDLESYDDKRFSVVYTEGPFTGKTMKEVFHIATPYDIYAFFNFAKSYPGKYMGTIWAINETFATWIMNDCPSGERDRDWLIPVIQSTSVNELGAVLKKISYYITIDTLTAWDNKIIEFTDAGKNETAEALCNKLIYVADYLNDDASLATFYVRRSFMKRAANDNKGALSDMLVAYNLYPTNDGFAWTLASMYGTVEQFDSCFRLYEMLMVKYPTNMDLKGGLGWYKTLAGKYDEAMVLCRAAYLDDTTSVNRAVNYGHTFLLTGNMDSAKYLYNRMLENLTKPTDYTDGPKKDFETFFSKGWQRKVVAEVAEWMDTEFKKKYSFITASNISWTDAKKFYDDGKYLKAITKFHEYINTLNQTADPDQRYIHTATVYIGHCYSVLKQKDSAIRYYTIALQISTQKLTNLRSQPEDDYIVNDYKRLYNYYDDDMQNRQMADGYKALYNAETQKLTEMNTVSHVHIICIGGNDTTTNNAYAANAKLFYDNIVTIDNTKDSASSRILLTGATLTKQAVVEKLKEIRKVSMPEDIFIFYYSGVTITEDNKEVFYFNPKDSVNGRIDARELMLDIDLIYAKKKLIITDDPEPQLLSMISSQYTSAGNYLNEIIFLCPGLKTPTTESGHSLFTNELVNGLTELKKKEKFSAKEFIDKASYALGRGEHYLPVLSFTYGRDFILYKNDSIKAMEIAQNRGLNFTTNYNDDNVPDQNTSSGTQKNYALFFASNEYDAKDTWHPLSNPIADATALAKLLREDFGFTVEIVRNANKREVQDKLREYRSKKYNANDQLMIFFAGHGIYSTDANMGYIVAKDSRDPRTEDPDYNTYFSYGDLGNLYLKNIKCKRIFLVLDACFAGSFFEETRFHRGADMQLDDKDVQVRLGKLKKNASGKTYYKGISSGGKETVEDGKKDQHSPFASGLIQMLNNAIASQYITADAIIGEIQNYHPGNTTPSSGTFNYSDPQGIFIFEVKTVEQKEAIKGDNLKKK